MFGKLFGRGRAKRDQLGLEISASVLGIPGSETTTITTTSDVADVPGMDVNAILAAVRAAQEQTGGDREAMAEILRERLGTDAVVVERQSTVDWSVMPRQQDPIALLATLTELREKGVVSDEQFEAQKRRLLG